MEVEKGTPIVPPKRTLSARKEDLDHVATGGASGVVARRQSSVVATIGGCIRSWWPRRNQTDTSTAMTSQDVNPSISPTSVAPSPFQREPTTSPTFIPKCLSQQERSCYEVLIKVVDARRKTGIKPPRIVVITDLAKDYDDLAAMVILKELHRLGVVILIGFVANLMPAKKRALFGRGALDELGLPDIPIATGTSGFPIEGKKKHEELAYEFDCSFMAEEENEKVREAGKGEDLLKEKCEDAVATGEQLTLLLISSLEDMFTFSQNHADLLKNAVSNIVLQGGYAFSPDGNLEPDEAAANNRYDMDAARSFHAFMQESNIPSAVYTKVAAFATSLTSELFDELSKTNHPVGEHLRKVQVEQDRAFYKTASSENPEDHFAPFMDQTWFLKNKTSWFEKEHSPDTPYPKGDEVIPYLTKVIVYDALAALGSSGEDAIDALNVLTDGKAEPPSIHRIVGFAGPPSVPGIHPERMATVLSALLKGSLVTCKPSEATKPGSSVG